MARDDSWPLDNGQMRPAPIGSRAGPSRSEGLAPGAPAPDAALGAVTQLFTTNERVGGGGQKEAQIHQRF